MLNVYIWGNGKIAKNFLQKAKLKKDVQIKACIVSDISKDNTFNNSIGIPIITSSQVKAEDIDYLIIASSYTNEIILQLVKYSIIHDSEQVVILRPTPGSDALGFNNLNLGKLVENLTDFMNEIFSSRNIIVWRNGSDYHRPNILWKENNGVIDGTDYIRVNTFDLTANIIEEEQIPGSVAELGVFQGHFSRYINKKFPRRRLYLFDTFEGFNKEEAYDDVKKGNSNIAFVSEFDDTSTDLVLSKMCMPQNCIIRKGLFPNSLQENDLKENFAFVSIDVDFENSIYEGLKYFYPRLAIGGYIFIHDYNHLFLHGVKKGIQRYEFEFGKVKKVPISDEAGTLIITK